MALRKIAVKSHLLLIISITTATIAVTTGCGNKETVRRHAVRGNVTFQGKPISSGDLFFEPDGAAGNQGPASWSEITNGRYAIGRAKGHIGGAYIIRVTGYGEDTIETPDGPAPKVLFDSHLQKCDLPHQDATHDINVVLSPAARR